MSVIIAGPSPKFPTFSLDRPSSAWYKASTSPPVTSHYIGTAHDVKRENRKKPKNFWRCRRLLTGDTYIALSSNSGGASIGIGAPGAKSLVGLAALPTGNAAVTVNSTQNDSSVFITADAGGIALMQIKGPDGKALWEAPAPNRRPRPASASAVQPTPAVPGR